MTTIDAINAILKTIGRKRAKADNKCAKTGKLSGKVKFVKLTKPAKKDKTRTVTIRKSFREPLT
jgi:hypothetical protein